LWLLLLLPLLLLVYFGYNRWHVRSRKKIGNPVLVKNLLNGYSASRRHIKFILLLFLVAVAIVTLAGPRTQGKGLPDERKGIDVVIALDVSKSMLASDQPPNRLENAKTLLKNILAERKEDRIGLVLFAGHAYTQMPLSYDHNSAELFINNADPLTFTAQGTAIADALEKSRNLLISETRRYRVILLVTDGETFDQDAQDGNALSWADECARSGIMIITAGLGSTTGTTIIDPQTHEVKKDRSGNVVTSALNARLLQDIATKTKGEFVLFTKPDAAAKQVLQRLSEVKQTILVDESLISYNSLYLWLAVPLVFLLVIEFFIPLRKKNRV
jgi:Ca-activated chloride channel homolog